MSNDNTDDTSMSGSQIAIFIIIFIIGIILSILFWYFIWKYFKGQSDKTEATYKEGEQLCIDQFKDNDMAKEKCLHDIIQQKTTDSERHTHEKEGLGMAILAEDLISSHI